MTQVAVCFTVAVNGIRMSTTTKVAETVRRIGRSVRSARTHDILLTVVADAAAAKKFRRVLERHWQDQRSGAGVLTVSVAEVRQVVTHIADTYNLTCYGSERTISPSARNLVLQRFSRGPKARWQPSGTVEQAALDELLAAGVITRHQRRDGVVEYRGTERAPVLARGVAAAHVPARGRVEPPAPRPAAVTELVVVPEPNMSREELLYQLEQHKDDPPDRLQQGYRYAAINLRDRIGGLASIGGLSSAQKDGAAAFKTAFEHGQLGAAQAVDYERTKVDTSTAANTVMDSGAAARAEFYSARTRLGVADDEEDRKRGIEHPRLAVAERLILNEQSARQVADALGYRGGRGRAAVTALVREAATILAEHFGVVSSSRRRRVRFDGDKPQEVNDAFRTEVPHPKGAKREKA